MALAHEAGIEGYADTVQRMLDGDLFTALAGTDHQHQSVVATPDDRAIVVTVKVMFSPIVAKADVQELIDRATGDLGPIPEA